MLLVKQFREGFTPYNLHFKGYFRTEMALITGADSVNIKSNCKIRITIVTPEDFFIWQTHVFIRGEIYFVNIVCLEVATSLTHFSPMSHFYTS